MNVDLVLDALLSSPTTPLIGADRDGHVTMWSTGAESMLGWTSEQMLGAHVSKIVPAERRQELEIREKVVAGTSVPPLETVRLAADGSLVPVEMHVTAVHDGGQDAVGTVALFRDLRRARRAELALRATAEELRTAFAASPVPQSRVDLAGRVLAVNAAMEELLGAPADELVGLDALALYVPEDRPGFEAAVAELAAGRVSYVRQERTLQRGDGRLVPIVVTVTLLHDVDGTPVLAGAVEDVTALREAEGQLRAQAARFDALLETMPVAVFTFDRDAICTSSRGQGLQRLGLGQDELVGADLLHTYRDDPRVLQAVQAALRGEDSRMSGESAGRHWDAHYRPLRRSDGVVTGGIGIALDVTDLVAAERVVRRNEARLQALLRHSGDLVLVVDDAGRLLWVSPAVQGVLGHDAEQLFWQPLSHLVHPDDAEGLRRGWPGTAGRSVGELPSACRLRRADGTWRWFDVHVADLRDDPAVEGVVVNLRDQTERREAEQEAQRLALHDPLTGLPNRGLLLDRIGQALVWGQQGRQQSGLVVLGVVGMTHLNELLGHEVGDLVLCSVAGRLQEMVRSTDSVARVGGDRFAVLVEDVSSAEELRTRAATLRDALEGPVPLPGIDVDLRFRTGSAMTPAAGPGALLSVAERAMAGSGSADRPVTVAQGRPPEDAAAQAAVRELQRAIVLGQLRLHFQPVIDLTDGVMVGAEALVRWEHPVRGLLLPGEFVPLAEASGLILDLGAWVLREACGWAARWQADGHLFGVGVNLAPLQMIDRSLVDLVDTLLRETGARASGLVLEVTESSVMDVPTATGVLEELRRLGVRLALDDFGTGYSSLTYLRRFPVDALKIDRSFVAGLGRDADDDAIVASVTSLGRSVGKLVVAEGVETAAQLQALRALGVDQAQGYYWSPALPPDELADWYRGAGQQGLPAVPPPAAGASREAPAGVVPEEAPQILRLHAEGASLHTIAALLNAEGRRTAEGRRWTTTTVARVVAAGTRR